MKSSDLFYTLGRDDIFLKLHILILSLANEDILTFTLIIKCVGFNLTIPTVYPKITLCGLIEIHV